MFSLRSHTNDFQSASIKIVFRENFVNNFNLFLHLMVFTDFRRSFFARSAKLARYAFVKIKFINKLAAMKSPQSIPCPRAITRNYAIFQCATWLRHKCDFRHWTVLNSVTCLKGLRKKKRKREKQTPKRSLKLSSETLNCNFAFSFFPPSSSNTKAKHIVVVPLKPFAKRLKFIFFLPF